AICEGPSYEACLCLAVALTDGRGQVTATPSGSEPARWTHEGREQHWDWEEPMEEITTFSEELRNIADRWNEPPPQSEQTLKKGLHHAMEAGRLLLEAKTKVEHGQWLPWLSAHCEFSERLAQKYMRIAKELPKLEQADPANTPRMADLSFGQVL